MKKFILSECYVGKTTRNIKNIFNIKFVTANQSILTANQSLN